MKQRAKPRAREGDLEKAQRRLREATISSTQDASWEESLRALADGSPVAMFLIQDGKFRFTNPQFHNTTSIPSLRLGSGLPDLHPRSLSPFLWGRI